MLYAASKAILSVVTSKKLGGSRETIEVELIMVVHGALFTSKLFYSTFFILMERNQCLSVFYLFDITYFTLLLLWVSPAQRPLKSVRHRARGVEAPSGLVAGGHGDVLDVDVHVHVVRMTFPPHVGVEGYWHSVQVGPLPGLTGEAHPHVAVGPVVCPHCSPRLREGLELRRGVEGSQVHSPAAVAQANARFPSVFPGDVRVAGVYDVEASSPGLEEGIGALGTDGPGHGDSYE